MTEPQTAIDLLRTIVGVEPIDERSARGSTTGSGGAPRRGLFGGQMIAQSLAACAHTVPAAAVPASIHVDLLRTGQSGDPMEFRIERVRDGGSLQHRDVRGYQDDVLIVHATVVASVPADGLDWQRHPMPPVGAPDTSPRSRRRAMGPPPGVGNVRSGVPDLR